MLASITPLGERGRRSRWPVTVSAFILGAALAGAAAGAALGGVGDLLLAGNAGGRTRLAVLSLGLVAALALDLRPARVPGPRRQVNERWLDEFRGWVYGFGFGAQLGLGVTTVVSSAATYVAGLAALLSGSPANGMIILGGYGLIRGATPLTAAWVRRPDQLMAMHAAIERWRGRVSRTAAVLLAALLILAVGGAA